MPKFPVEAAGDALEIAEASSAMFNGKIAGVKIAADLKGNKDNPIPKEWYAKAEELKLPPGITKSYQTPEKEERVFPVLHCLQEIPCNPCTTVCPTNSIKTEDGLLMGVSCLSRFLYWLWKMPFDLSRFSHNLSGLPKR